MNLTTMITCTLLLAVSGCSQHANSEGIPQQSQIVFDDYSIAGSQLAQVQVAAGDRVRVSEVTTVDDSASDLEERPGMSPDVMYLLLVAEIALDRGKPDVALKNYYLATKMSQDAGIAKQATQLAVEMQRINEAIELATIWADSSKQDLQAQLVAVTLLLGRDQAQAVPYLEQAIAIRPKQIDEFLVQLLSRMSNSSREALHQITTELAKTNPDNPYMHLVAAQISAHQGDTETSQTLVSVSLKHEPNLSNAVELQAKLIRHQQNSEKPALEYLDKHLVQYPDNAQIRMFYSTALLDNKIHDKAEEHLIILTNHPDYRGDALLYLAEMHMVDMNWSSAIVHLEQAATSIEHANTAHYMLGNIAEHQDKHQKAVEHYLRVDRSDYHIAAYIRAAMLLNLSGQYAEALEVIRNSEAETFIEQKQLLLTEIEILLDANLLDDAMALSSEVLVKLPYDIDFLYARSLVAAMMDQIDMVEQDLKTILMLDPMHTDAMNALGYTLAAKTNRFEEAMDYLKQAIKLEPENPAYMDSIGWLYFRMGQYQQAVVYLNQAWSITQDSEIAAHLGEALWMSGKKTEALAVWAVALENTPSHPMLLKTVERLKADDEPASPVTMVVPETANPL